MAKVAEMIGDHAQPRGNSGYAVDQEHADKLAQEMRRILNLDLEETDIATQVQIYNAEMDQEEQIAAWEYLNAGERATWRRFVGYEEWLRNEKAKRDAH
jgi:glycogen synthase